MKATATTNDKYSFGDYFVFVDESGDHGLARVDPGYPIFLLAFCLFSKGDWSPAGETKGWGLKVFP